MKSLCFRAGVHIFKNNTFMVLCLTASCIALNRDGVKLNKSYFNIELGILSPLLHLKS